MTSERRAFLAMLEQQLQELEADRDEAKRALEDAQKKVRELDEKLSSGRAFYNLLGGGDVADSVFDTVTTGVAPTAINSNGKWTNVPVMGAIEQVLEGVPNWEQMERRAIYEMLLDRLRSEHYPFTKRPHLSVNRALTHFLDKQGIVLREQETE